WDTRNRNSAYRQTGAAQAVQRPASAGGILFGSNGSPRNRYLNVSLDAVLHPPSLAARRAAESQQVAANTAPPVKEKELTAQEYFERGFDTTDADEKLRFYTQAIRLKPDF